jgi:hypothetical protein
MEVPTPVPTPPRPSMSAALKSVASAATSRAGPWAGVAVAIVGGLVTQWQSNQASDDTARVSYETLAAARLTDSARIDVCYEGLEKLRVWNQDLSDRIDRRAATTAKQIERKVNKPSAPPVVAPKVEPAPPAPVPPVPPAPVRLPPFDALAKAAEP